MPSNSCEEEGVDIDDNDGDGGRSDAGKDQPPTINSLKGVIIAVNSKTLAKNSSFGKGHGGTDRGSRRSLGTLEPDIMLTAEALYHHNNYNHNKTKI